MGDRNRTARGLAILCLLAGFQAATGRTASLAQDNPSDATFGSRTDKPDGSIAMTIGRRLQTEWDTKLGMDARLAPEPGTAMADTALQGTPSNRSSGAVWGNMTGPSPAPVLWDKTSVDARLDPSQEQGQFGATLSRTLPLGDEVSVTLQDKYSVTQTLLGSARNPQIQTAGPPGAPVWETDRSLRFNLTPTGTTLSAGITSSSNDRQLHNKFSAEQQLAGPLSVTTSITDPTTAASGKSISARFKHTW
jgi:hypothetical protein